MRPITLLSLLLAVSAILAATPTRAAESYDNCAGTISSLPTVITGQGVWCLKADLVTAMWSGDAINVATNNVTIDCNGFKIGGLAAGPDTIASGIRVTNRANVTIRGCNLRGFSIGLMISGSGHIVEDNRIEGSRHEGIHSNTDGIIIRRNLIMDTGGSNALSMAIEYNGDSDILDNTITGVFPIDSDLDVEVRGISTTVPSESRIRGNVVRGLTTNANSGYIIGIRTSTGNSLVTENYLSAAPGPAAMTAIFCGGASGFIRDNRADGFDAMTSNCPADISGNLLH